MDRIGNPRQTRNKFIVPGGCLPDVSLAFAGFIHEYPLHEAQTADNTPGPLPHVFHTGIGDQAVQPVEVFFGGGILDAVGHVEIAELNRLEQVRVTLSPRIFGIVPFK